MIFADGFESGNFSVWSASANDNGDLGVTTAAALVGARTPQEVDQNVDGAALQLTAAELAKIDEIFKDARGMHARFDPFGHPMDDWSPPQITAEVPIPAR